MQGRKTCLRVLISRLLTVVILFSFISINFVNVSALAITNRKVIIGNSAPSANTTYNFTFTLPSSTIVKSIKFQVCEEASGSCTAASGFSSQTPGATLNGQPTNLGSGGGWSVDNSVTSELRIANNSNTGSPSSGVTVNFSNVHNPSYLNSSFYIWITTYSNADWTGAIDTGVVASSTAGQVTATAIVDESLSFVISNQTVDLGRVTKITTGAGTSTMTIGTNAASGYSVSYSGSTLTSGSDTIDAMAALGASSTNTEQFGINLVANTTPSIGSNKTGTGVGTVANSYNQTNQFMFNTAGDVVASSAGPSDDNNFTTSYIANITPLTAAGVYTTVINYIATANF